MFFQKSFLKEFIKVEVNFFNTFEFFYVYDVCRFLIFLFTFLTEQKAQTMAAKGLLDMLPEILVTIFHYLDHHDILALRELQICNDCLLLFFRAVNLHWV